MGSKLKGGNRMTVRRMAAVLCFAVMALAAAASAAEMRVLTTEEPPMNFSDRGTVSGFSTDIVREILRRTKTDAPDRPVTLVEGLPDRQLDAERRAVHDGAYRRARSRCSTGSGRWSANVGCCSLKSRLTRNCGRSMKRRNLPSASCATTPEPRT